MRLIWVSLCLSFVILFGSNLSATAKTPPEVLEPYKAYRAALKDNDMKTAKAEALKAWKVAEDMLGDHQVTGDLALNYAGIHPAKTEKNPYKNYKSRVKAYKRAVALSKFYDEESLGVIEIERRIKLADLQLTLRKRGVDDWSFGNLSTINEIKSAIETYDMQGSTFEGDLYVLYARFMS